MQYQIPCGHYAGNIDMLTTIPDHHPLSALQVETLLVAAMTADVPTLCSICERLAQGIPGMTCPRPGPASGLPGQKLDWLQRYFYEHAGHWSDPEVVAAISALMSD